MKYFVYILESKDNSKYYIGQTDNVDCRIIEHNQGKSSFTDRYKNWFLVYKKEFDSRNETVKFERFVKRQKNRLFIKKLIDSKFIPR